jgi:mono/diheme cytochrome c family protein
MVLGFLLFWILLAAAVFFVAMRGGPRGARAALHGQSRLTQRLLTLGVALLFAAGLVVPTLVLAFNGANKASAGIGGVHLSAAAQHGRTLFERSCATCHTLAGAKSVGHVGPNLDVLLGRNIATVSGRKALVLDAIANGRARGMGQMPALLYQGYDARAIADFVSAVAGH